MGGTRLVHLTQPLFFSCWQFAGLMLEETAVDFSPCLVSIHTGVAMADGTLVNIAPEAVRVMTNGAMLWPQGVNLQPALLFVSPMGANVQVK